MQRIQALEEQTANDAQNGLVGSEDPCRKFIQPTEEICGFVLPTTTQWYNTMIFKGNDNILPRWRALRGSIRPHCARLGKDYTELDRVKTHVTYLQ